MQMLVAIVGLLGLVLAACTRPAAVPPGERHFFVNAIEVKGSTTTDGLAPPTANPEELS